MKKFRFLVLSMLLVLSMVFFTGCGVDEPTVADVEKALKDEGYIPDEDGDKDEDADKDSSGEASNEAVSDGEASEGETSDEANDEGSEKKESKVEYSVVIDKCKLNDDKDKANVDATLTVTEDYLETKTEFEITFKLKDDKTWKCKEVELEDEESVLIAGIPDAEAEELAKDYYYSLSDSDIYIYEEDITSAKAGSHENDLGDLKDVVTMTICGVDGLMEAEFEAEVTFEYSTYDGEWFISEVDVDEDSATVGYVESYKFAPSADDVVAAIQEDEYIYVLGSYYYYSEGTISDLTIDTSVQPEGSYYHTAPCTWTYTCDDVTMSVSAEVEFYFNDEEWEYDYVCDDTVTSWSSDASGTWTGTHEGVGKVTIEIPTELNEDEDLIATVTVVSTDNGTYSWLADVWTYEQESGYIDLDFEEWITLPSNGSYYDYESYYGYIVDGKWSSGSSWDNYTFTKSN